MDSRVEQLFAPEEKPEMPRREEKALREIIALVRPLLWSRDKQAMVDIDREILLPAETCRWREHYDLENLCEVFRGVLEKIGSTMLSTLATYVSSFDVEDTLAHFFDEFDHLTTRLINARFTSIADAFRIGFTEGQCDEPF